MWDIDVIPGSGPWPFHTWSESRSFWVLLFDIREAQVALPFLAFWPGYGRDWNIGPESGLKTPDYQLDTNWTWSICFNLVTCFQHVSSATRVSAPQVALAQSWTWSGIRAQGTISPLTIGWFTHFLVQRASDCWGVFYRRLSHCTSYISSYHF